MIYSFPITVLTTYTKAAPSETTLKLTHGIVHRVIVEFPAGCRGMVHCTLWYQEHQVIPLNSDSSLAGDTFPVDFEEYLEMLQPPFVLKARCWAVGTVNNHTIIVRLGLLPPEAYWKSGATQELSDRLAQAFGLT